VLCSEENLGELHENGPLQGTRYRILSRVGSGAMGEVFLVEHAALGRRFVAKVLHARYSEADEYVARMRREARALGQLRHPNIVTITDFAITDAGRPFFVMEYLEGETLHERLRRHHVLPRQSALSFARQMLAALAAAHARGIVHRDIKPQNLFIQERPNAAPLLKVLDFGAARDTQSVVSGGVSVATKTGTVLGTLGYLSPEAADGQRVDQRADLYAVGLVLTVMLAGRLPKPVASPSTELARAALGLPANTADLSGAILRALAPSPAERFQNAEEFLAALPES